MREILFRGKKTWDGLWVYGMPTYTYDMSGSRDKSIQAIIQSGNIVESMVNPFTFGQYTGLKDKNGNKIFEGDIIEIEDIYGLYLHNPNTRNVIEFYNGSFILRHILDKYASDDSFHLSSNNEDSIIVGNIHDNPELLKGEREWKE